MPQSARAGLSIVHISTDEVYGTLGDTVTSLRRLHTRQTHPAASKAAADHLVRAYYETYGLSTVITQLLKQLRPHQFPEKLIPVMVLNAIRQAAAHLW
jgi:dTDP-glucose 4,6-dehydratase